jgi:hypothetical protein
MEIWMLKVALAAIVMAGGLVGCCPHERKPKNLKLPPPIGLGMQVNRLNDRSRALTNVTMGGTVVIRYEDEKGRQQQTAEGRLLIRQRQEGQDSGDVFISGRAFGQEVFRAGKNPGQWFFLIYLDPKRAWMGPVDSEGGKGGAVLRADTVLDVLGVTQLPAKGATVGMLVRDETRSNNLLEMRSQQDQPASWIRREIVVDRDSGDIREVNLYDPNGILVVRAELKEYRAITYREGDEAPQGFKPPRFPFDIWIYYLAQKASIHFTVHNEDGMRAELRERLPDRAFELPDLEGFKINRQ